MQRSLHPFLGKKTTCVAPVGAVNSLSRLPPTFDLVNFWPAFSQVGRLLTIRVVECPIQPALSMSPDTKHHTFGYQCPSAFSILHSPWLWHPQAYIYSMQKGRVLSTYCALQFLLANGHSIIQFGEHFPLVQSTTGRAVFVFTCHLSQSW